MNLANFLLLFPLKPANSLKEEEHMVSRAKEPKAVLTIRAWGGCFKKI